MTVQNILTVHILHHGLPLCGFSHELPRDWPPGHKWVGKDEAELATCALCQDRANQREYDALKRWVEEG
jgi:hypothetical protein